MNKLASSLLLLFLSLCPCLASADNWPDGTKMDKWFSDTTKLSVGSLGKQSMSLPTMVSRTTLACCRPKPFKQLLTAVPRKAVE